MTYQIIKAPITAKYLKDISIFEYDLPDNCYLDKTITGSGGTTHALTNEVPYIVTVPFISLAENKQAQHSGKVLAVHGGVSDERIKRFISKGGQKFIVTYDSLPRLVKFINKKEYKLLVDEAHKLVEYGADFKPAVIHNILTTYQEYKSYIFMTATPTREEYLPDELTDITKLKVIWTNTTDVSLIHQRCNLQFDSIVSNICLDHLKGIKEGNAYLFYNSVKAIIKTIKTLKKVYPNLSPDDVKIICANTNKNQEALQQYLGAGWSISKPVERDEDGELLLSTKTINFLTATAFEGIDVYDTEGVTYIISDGRKVHTKLDITTQVSQIVGRIRNSRYNNKIYMLWTHSPIESCVSEKEYNVLLEDQERRAKSMLQNFETGCEDTQQALINYTKTNPFFIEVHDDEGSKLVFNTVAKKALMNSYVGMELTYTVINNTSYTDQDTVVVSLRDVFTKEESIQFFQPLSGVDKLKVGKAANFKKVAHDYEQALVNGDQESKETIETDIDYKDLVDFVEIFGLNKLTAVDYRLKRMQEELDKYRLFNDTPEHITNCLRLQRGLFYPLSILKEKLNNIYEDLGIKKKAKASDITNIYNTSKTVRSGINGYLIVK